MIDFLLPAEDHIVLIQLVSVAAIGGVAVFATRRHPDIRLFVIGMVLLLLGAMGLRALH